MPHTKKLSLLLGHLLWKRHRNTGLFVEKCEKSQRFIPLAFFCAKNRYQTVFYTKAIMKSPCIRMCTLNDDEVCLGCGRLLTEITSWTGYSEQQRKNVSTECVLRLKALEQGEAVIVSSRNSRPLDV